MAERPPPLDERSSLDRDAMRSRRLQRFGRLVGQSRSEQVGERTSCPSPLAIEAVAPASPASPSDSPPPVEKGAAALGAVVDDAGTSAPWGGGETVGASAYGTATVTAVEGFAPAGTVTYSFFTNATCAGAASATDTVSLSGGNVPDSTPTGALAAGPQGFQASYSGDGNYRAGSVACEPFTVLEAPLITSADGATFTILEASTFTVTTTGYPSGAGISLSDGGASLPSGVSFVDNGNGTATLAGTPALGMAGSYPLTVAADNGVAPVGSQGFTLTVDVAGTATILSSSTNPSVVGESVVLTASVDVTGSGSGSPTGAVSFEEGGSTIPGCGSLPLSAGSAGCTTSFASAGSDSLTAAYSGDANFATSAADSVTQDVAPASTATVAVSSANPAVTGESVTYTATVSRTVPATGTPAGDVAFTDGAGNIAGCTAVILTDGVATCTVSYPVTGSHSIVASFGGDADDVTSIAATLTEEVDQDSTVTTLTSSPNPSTVGQPVTITATVTASAPGTGNPTGSVVFYVDGTAVGTAPLDSSVDSRAVYTTTGLTVGTHASTATYGGDAGYVGSAAAASADSQVVAPLATVPVTGGGAAGWAAGLGALLLMIGGLTLALGARRRSGATSAPS
jgi:hypothetical protein